jgi:hypothetical protein
MLNPNNSWISRLKKGDVLRSRSGMLRIIRRVSHSKIPFYGIRTTVTFTIQTCSWTGRPYTIYTGNDLVQMGYEQVDARFALRRKFDRALELDFEAPTAAACEFSCCDVRGVA